MRPASAPGPDERALAFPPANAAARERAARVDLWIPALYVLASGLWLALSEILLAPVVPLLGEHATWSVAKALGFVTVTAAVLHVGLRWSLAGQRAAYQALRESDERKSGFIAMLSHELRNPLAPLRHALWLLDRVEPASAEAARARATLGRQLLHLTRLTDDLLDVTRVSRGRVRLQRTRIDLVDLVRRTVEDHASLFASRHVTLDARLPDTPLAVDADPTRLTQVVGNVLWNAAKFTEPGGHAAVLLEVAPGAALLRVSDDGVGIHPALLGHVFEPFVQEDATLDRTRGGLGLGLAIARALVELHGGAIEARSDGPGRGAEFRIRLPLADAPAPAPDPAARRAAPARGHRVLVVEDNADAAEVLREMLLLWEHEVEIARDGREGLEKARAFLPDVVLCDIGLPVMNGYEVARAMRADPALAGVFLVAVTGYASQEDATRAAGAGFDRHLGKPVPVELLEEVLATAPRAAQVLH